MTLEQLGESALPWYLLDLLGRAGWRVVVQTPEAAHRGDAVQLELGVEPPAYALCAPAPFAGEGVAITAARGDLEVHRCGDSVGAIAREIFKEASRLHSAAGYLAAA